MLTRENILKFIKTLPDTVNDYPFEGDFFTTVLRHASTKKWFGILLNAPLKKVGIDSEGYTEVICLKCPPDLSPFLIDNFKAVVPAYHMNKKHWISIILNGDLPEQEAQILIALSYDLTKK